MEGQITEEFMKESEVITTLAALLCRINADVHRLQLLNLHSFPDTVGEMIYEEKGMTITPRGDAYMVRQCKKIGTYHVLWNQRLNETCYQLFPVRLPKNKTKYLELNTRRLMDNSAKIKCQDRHKTTYIRDAQGEFWRYKLERKGFHKVRLKDHYFQQKMALPKLRTYTPKLLHYEKTRPHRTTLLDVLAAQQENLDTLTDYRTIGGGDIVKGIAAAMGEVVETVTDTATNIFSIIAHGATDVTNDTVQAVDNIGSTLVDIVTFTGGPSNLILYVIDLGIIIYLIYRHRTGYQQIRRQEPPPVPEHQNYLTPIDKRGT